MNRSGSRALLLRISTSPSCRFGPICHPILCGRQPSTLRNFTVLRRGRTFHGFAIFPLPLQPTIAHIAIMQLQTAMLSTLLITLVAFIALGLAAAVPVDNVDPRALSFTNASSSIEVERRFIPSTTPKACLGTNIFCLTYVGSEVHVESSAVCELSSFLSRLHSLQLDRRALGPVHPRGNVAWVYTHDDARWRTWGP